MLDIKFIRENVELVKQNCVNRHVKIDIDALLTADEERRNILKQIEELRAERNQGSKGKPTPEEIEKMKAVGEEIKKLEENQAEIDTKYKELLMQVPNLTHPDTPIGGEDAYVVVFKNKEPEPFDFEPKDHETLMLDLDMIDFERGAKVTGAKFYFCKNDLVRLNQALINYALDTISKHGYQLIETPDIAKNEILIGTGYNPRGEETQIYSLENTDLSLIGTAEITVGGYHQNEILDLSKGPKKYVAISHCFRTEAGAYGRTSKGLYRVHQFTKVEMFIYCKPEESENLHQELVAIEKELCDGIGFPYRVIDIPSGDLGGPAYRKYDIEAWMTMKGGEGKQGDYGEITSTSNCLDYQARRLNIRYKNAAGETEFVHTLNGTGIPTSRWPLAIAENFQNADGSITVPEVLRKYMGKDLIKSNS